MLEMRYEVAGIEVLDVHLAEAGPLWYFRAAVVEGVC